MSRILIISDNSSLVRSFSDLIEDEIYRSHQYEFRCTKGSETAIDAVLTRPIQPIVVKEEWKELTDNFDLIISLHCKQLFPVELVNRIRCINVHPGLNPFNRGWFPQVFSILNGLPTGATIHEIDEELDHGKIIAQTEVPNYAWDTSIDIYNRVLQAEVELLKTYLPKIISGDYTAYAPEQEGNVNLKKDFNALCELDLSKKQSVGETIDLLRALTHGQYKNAFFFDPQTGKKVYVSISCEVEK